MGISVRSVAGVGILIVSDDIQVPPVRIIGPGQLDVILIPNPSAQPDTPYIIPLRIDNVEVGLQAVEWTAAEIAAAEPIPISFTGIDLAGVTSIIVSAGFDDAVAIIDAGDGSGAAGATIDVEVRMREVPAAGLAGYTIFATLFRPGASVIEFVDVIFPPSFPLGSHTPDPASGPTIEISAVDLNTVVNGGDVDVLLATLQVALLPGAVEATELLLEVTRLDDDGGFPIRSATLAGTITVS
jgi:hypothetical protein